MTSPWGSKPPSRRPRWWVIAATAVGCVLLAVLVTSALRDSAREPDWSRLVYLLILGTLVGSGILHFVRESPSIAFRNAAIWLGIAGLLIVGYSFRPEFSAVADRVSGNLMPASGIASDGEITFYAADGGHFYVEADVEGTPIVFLVDTGASDIVLSPRDARRLGWDLRELRFTRLYNTANGIGQGAPVTLKTLAVGPIFLSDLPASVNRADLDTSLLGMTFLRRLSSYEASADRLTLRP